MLLLNIEKRAKKSNILTFRYEKAYFRGKKAVHGNPYGEKSKHH